MTDQGIRPEDFRAWQTEVARTGQDISKIFDKSKDTISTWRHRGVPERDAGLVRLAMSAVAAGIGPWHPA